MPKVPHVWERWRPSVAVAVGVALGLILVGLGMALYNEQQSKAQKVRDVTVQAHILAGSVAAPLAFDDQETTREYVDAERSNPEVEAAGVYQLNGRLAAGFVRAGAPLPPTNVVRGASFEGDRLVVTVPVIQGRTELGSAYLRTIQEPLARRATRYSGIALLIVMAALLVAGLGASNASLVEAHRKLRREMTEREKAEEALRHSQKMEALAQLEVAAERGRAALRASEEHLEFAMRAGELGTWTRDLRTNRLTASSLFLNHCGIGPDLPPGAADLIAKRIHRDDRASHFQSVDEAVANHSVFDTECRIANAAGELRWIRFRGRAEYDADGAPLRISGVSMDATARKGDEELRDQLIEQLTSSNEELARFAHVASHDLREPLRMVAAFCGLLSKDYGERLDERGREYLSLAVSGSVQMQALLDDLVEYGRLGLEAERNVWFDSAAGVDRALENLHEAIQDSQAKIVVGDLPRIYGNPIRFNRLLQNLIGNALKYVNDGVTPNVRVSAQAEDGFWRFSVTDNGIGIEQRHQEQIFEPFKRLHGKSRYYGTGLGLAICRKIVEGFGGRIGVSSAPGKGSTFSFTVKTHQEESDNARHYG